MTTATKTINRKGITDKNRFKAAEKYLKGSVKLNFGRPSLHGAWIKNGKQYMSNSHSGIELVNIIEGLTQIEEGVKTYDLTSIIEKTKKHATIKQPDPDITALKAQLTEAKAEAKEIGVKLIEVDKAFTKIGEANFNINLLLKTIAVLPGELEYYISEYKAEPLLILDNNGNSAVVLPIRMPE